MPAVGPVHPVGGNDLQPKPSPGGGMKSGNKSGYTPELGEQITLAISQGQTLKSICSAPDMPNARTVNNWIIQFPDFRDKYEQARRLWGDALFEQIAELSSSVPEIT